MAVTFILLAEKQFLIEVSVCNYQLAMTQPSGDFIFALIFGYARLM
jgi:hypothetical protein